MVEIQPGIFREVSNDVDAIEQWTAVCSSLGRLMPHSHHDHGGVLGGVLGHRQGGR
jgi:hypothetical protein